MGIAYITELAELAVDEQGNQMQIEQQPALHDQTVSFSATHGESTAFRNDTKFVCINVDSTCSYVFGTSPVATTSNMRMSAGDTKFIGVASIQGLKVSFVANT